jgi:hypothetical protein
VSPDYTSAFHQLAAAGSLVELDVPFYIGHGGVSNGASTMRNGVATYAGSFGLDPYGGCPLPIDTVVNTTIRDYLWVAGITGADLPAINLVGYLLLNYRELQLKRELGSPLDVTGMRRAILGAAAQLSGGDKADFEAGRKLIDARETPAFRLRNLLVKSGALALAKRVASRLGLQPRKTGPRYFDVLEAAREVPLRPWDS